MKIENFLSCDWGSSAFRLRYVNIFSLGFHSVTSADKGIVKVFEAWKQSGRKEEERFSFYLDIIRENITRLEQQVKVSVKDIPLIISGMASSSIGMIDIPYKKTPFKADGSNLECRTIKKTKDFSHDILIISGAKTGNDAMRGEETQLAGCTPHKGEERLFIFPGTHSKHIRVKKRRVIDCTTYMTGEFFDLLSEKSILANSVEKGAGLKDRATQRAFRSGVRDSKKSSVLHTSFLVRTNELFKKMTKQENYYYLSGLLIGAELTKAIGSGKKITLVVNESMKLLYVTALEVIGLKKTKNFFLVQDVERVLIKGQLEIWAHVNGVKIP